MIFLANILIKGIANITLTIGRPSVINICNLYYRDILNRLSNIDKHSLTSIIYRVNT